MNFDRNVKREMRAAAIEIMAAQHKDRQDGVIPPGWEVGQRPVFVEPDAEMFAQHVDSTASFLSTYSPVGHLDAVRIVWATYTSWEGQALRVAWTSAAMSLLHLGMSPDAIVTAIHAARAVEARS
jgi:hypothetical protein